MTEKIDSKIHTLAVAVNYVQIAICLTFKHLPTPPTID